METSIATADFAKVMACLDIVVDKKAANPNMAGVLIDGTNADTAFNYMNQCALNGNKRPNTIENQKEAQDLEVFFRNHGLETHRETFHFPLFVEEFSSLEVTTPGQTEVVKVPSELLYNAAPGYHDISAPAVYVNEGKPQDYSGIDAREVLVMASTSDE